MVPALVIVVLVALVLLWVALGFNRLVRLRNRVDNAWAQVDVQLKRRYDLVPNLVEGVRAYAAHEKSTLAAVTEARGAARSANGVAARGSAESALSGALGNLLAVAESYPDLRSAENFRELQSELVSTEDRISAARQIFNDTTLNYNDARSTFPRNLLAGAAGFSPRPYFEAEERSRPAPPVRM